VRVQVLLVLQLEVVLLQAQQLKKEQSRHVASSIQARKMSIADWEAVKKKKKTHVSLEMEVEQ
jgi:hypothetical protein